MSKKDLYVCRITGFIDKAFIGKRDQMTHNKILLIVVMVMCVFLGSYTDGKTEEKTDGWISYGASQLGDHYYNEQSIKIDNPKVMEVSIKIKYSEEGKKRVLESRKKHEMPMAGYEKLNHTLILYRFDCANNSIKWLKYSEFNELDKILEEHEFPSPKTEQVSSGSLSEVLQKKVCK